MAEGWTESAEAWIADMGETGDWGRRYVLDPALLARVRLRPYRRALDIGCGEGRFCRILAREGIAATGLEPTARLLEEAQRRDPSGDYRHGRAEKLPFADAGFDLVLSCLTLIDIDDYQAAIGEMARVLAPGGTLLVANLTSFNTARVRNADDSAFHPMHRYMEERCEWDSWRGIRVQNWHRPLSAYMRTFLDQGLLLAHFDEPRPDGAGAAEANRYLQAPWFLTMEWRKPAAGETTH